MMNNVKELIKETGKLTREIESFVSLNDNEVSINKIETDLPNTTVKNYNIRCIANVKLETVSDSYSPFCDSSELEFNAFNVIIKGKETTVAPELTVKDIDITFDNGIYILQETEINHIDDLSDAAYKEFIYKQFYYEDLEKTKLVPYMEPVPRYEICVTVNEACSTLKYIKSRDSENTITIDFEFMNICTEHYNLLSKVDDVMNIEEIMFDDYNTTVDDVLNIEHLINRNITDLHGIVYNALGFNYAFTSDRETTYSMYFYISDDITLHSLTRISADNNSTYYRDNLIIFDGYYAFIREDNKEKTYMIDKDLFLEIVYGR